MGWGEPQGPTEGPAVDSVVAVLPARIVEHALELPFVGEMVPAGWGVAMADDGSIHVVSPAATDLVGVLERDRTPGGWRAKVDPGAPFWEYRDGCPSAVSYVVATIERAIEARS